MLKLAALLVIVPVCVFVPGFVLVRRFRIPDELRLGVSVGASLAFLYVAGFALYLVEAGPRLVASAYVAIAISILVAGVVHRRELLALIRSPFVNATLVDYAMFVAWLLLLSFAIRNFSGGAWSGDWAEHYERAVFFVERLPIDTRFIGMWSLTARPPLDNVVTAFFMRMAGTDFASYQLTSVLLGSLEFLGAASLWLAVARGGGERRYSGLLVLTALVALNPSVVQNATYTWTRALTNFFVLQGAALFLVALRERSSALRRWSYLHLGLGLATHYSTVPYLAAFAVVELYFLARRRLAISEAVLGTVLAAAPVVPWLAFAIGRFGLSGTFLANSTAVGSAGVGPAALLLRLVGNIWATLVPHPLREVPALFDQEYALGYARDYAFLIYQVSLPALMGSVGWLAVAWLLTKGAIRRVRLRRIETPVLVSIFLGTAVLLGIGSVAEDDPFGLAHVCLQPLGIAGLVYLAARWRETPAWLRGAAGLGLAVDAAFGIALHLWLEHLDLHDLLALDPYRPAVSMFLVGNLNAKLASSYVFLGDLDGSYLAIAIVAVALVALVALSTRRPAAELNRAAEPY